MSKRIPTTPENAKRNEYFRSRPVTESPVFMIGESEGQKITIPGAIAKAAEHAGYGYTHTEDGSRKKIVAYANNQEGRKWIQISTRKTEAPGKDNDPAKEGAHATLTLTEEGREYFNRDRELLAKVGE